MLFDGWVEHTVCKPHSGSCSVLLDGWAEHTVRKHHSASYLMLLTA